MSPALEAYISVLVLILLLVQPVFLILTIYAWAFAYRVYRSWYAQHEEDEPSPRVTVMIAISLTLAFICSTILTFLTIYRSSVGAIPDAWVALQATAVIVLAFTSYVPVFYLIVIEILNWRGGKR